MRVRFFWVFVLLLLFASLQCSGGGGSSSVAASLAYSNTLGVFRVGESATAMSPSLGGLGAAQFTISPALPSGLALHPTNGSISGTPSSESALQSYTVRAQSGAESVETSVSIVVGPSLPAEFASLETGFAASVFASNLATPVRMAYSPDGRIFFNELSTGNLRVFDAAGNLLAQPFATLPVLGGGHKGLLGLALDPNFDVNGFAYVTAATPASGGKPDRVQLIRFMDLANLGANATVLVDDLPIGQINDGGEIAFDLQGHLFVSVGDVENPALAQDSNSLAGKTLRFTKTGAIPADNPFVGSAEWCRGLRNTFAIVVHPQTGELFGADNGPASNDELNFLQAGKNFEWGMSSSGSGFEIGFKIKNWVEVIAPTSIRFHSGAGAWSAYRDRLLLTSYVDEAVHALRLSGGNFTDFEEDTLFAKFKSDQTNNKPLHSIELPDGSLLVSTFTKIYKVWKFGP